LAPRLTWSSQENVSGSVFRSQYAIIFSFNLGYRPSRLVIAGLDPAIHRFSKMLFFICKDDGPAGQARG
jgi:hypothetical protein